jgi:peptidoglycan hydrolase-like protein with peptidoglycan-binding domain
MVAVPAAAAPANTVDGFGASAPAAPNVPNVPVVAIASTPSGAGYWLATVTGQLTAAGDAGSIAASSPQPVIAIAAHGTHGVWMATARGHVINAGDAPDKGSTGPLNRPIVGMAATPVGDGYWLVASDGGVFSFGGAAFHGSTGNMTLNEPIVGMAPTPDGRGYWLVASDGGVFTFGDAVFHGSTGAMHLNQPIVGMAATKDGRGYWLAARDGGIFNFGDAPFEGSDGGTPQPETVGIAPSGAGFLLAHGELPADGDQSPGHLQALLATLGYLPLTWTPPGQQPGSPMDAAIAAHAPAGGGTFAWRFSPPPSLAGLWVAGQYTVIVQGAVMALESEMGMALDGQAGPAVWSALLSGRAPANTNGYTYALTAKAEPETLTVWHDGQVVSSSRANTGIAAAPTVDGTFPVFERLRSQIMTGVDPNGVHYADPVQWVAYFNGGDAVHYIARSSFGYPQSLGCVEVPYDTGVLVWPYLTYGTLVTVS